MIKSIRTAIYFFGFLLISGCPFLQDKPAVSSKENSSAANIAATPAVKPAETPADDKNTGTSVESFKPQNWYILAETTGDLDGDGKNDLAAVYSRDNPETDKQTVNEADGEAERLLVIALQGSDGKYQIKFSGSKVILCRNCGGMNNNVVPSLKITDQKFYVDQNVLATSDVNYHLEIILKNGEFSVSRGTVKNRERRTKEKQKKEIKTPMSLTDFDINNY